MSPEDEALARRGGESMYARLGARVSDVRHLAVLRANAMGDLVVALPALAALRCAYPEARISLIARDWHADFLRTRPSPIDDVLVLPSMLRLDAGDDPSLIETTQAALRTCAIDLALQLHGGGRYSNPFISQLGARVTAGLRTQDARPLDRELPYREAHPEVLRLLEVVALVGACGRDVEPHVAVTRADLAASLEVLPEDGRPLLVLQPGCRDPRRAWPPESFAAVADAFAARDAHVVLQGTADEAARLAEVRRCMRYGCTDLAGAVPLGALVGLLSRARLLISNDTGPAHLARALGTRTVTVCWIGNHAAYGPMSSRRHAVALSWQLDCPRCGQCNVEARCEHDVSFMGSIPPAKVLALAEPLWEEA